MLGLNLAGERMRRLEELKSEKDELGRQITYKPVDDVDRRRIKAGKFDHIGVQAKVDSNLPLSKS